MPIPKHKETLNSSRLSEMGLSTQLLRAMTVTAKPTSAQGHGERSNSVRAFKSYELRKDILSY